MTRTNWQDGGGYYPPGSDTPDAPWNQPDAPEPEQRDIDDAEREIYPFLHFETDATMNDIHNANGFLGTNGTSLVVEICEAVDGRPNPLMGVPDNLIEIVKAQAKAWVDERAQEYALERHENERDRLEAQADDDYDRMREEGY